MSPYFTHPVVLTLWSLASATTAVFGMLTLGNILTYRVSQRPEMRIHIGFTGFETLLALGVVMSFLPMSPLLKSQVFRLMWVSGTAGLGFWTWSLVTFAHCDNRLFEWLRYAFFAVSAIMVVDMLLAALTGWSWFCTLDPVPTESIAMLAANSPMRYRAFGNAVAIITILLTLATSVALVRTLIQNRRGERLLLFGVTLTPLFGCLEIGLVVAHSRYNMPLLFVAKLIEAARISWYTRDRLAQELNEVRAAQRDQAALLEAQLAQLERNARLAKVGQRTAELSHDIRNPLTTVVGTVELIETALKQSPPNTKEALELTESMHGALEHVLELVRRITRQAGEPVSPPKPISVERVVSNALALCKGRLDGVTVTVEIPGGSRVRGWATELTQLLVNLIVNSCDAIQDHAHPWIRIAAEENDGHLQLRVVDAGKRPPDNVLDKMFVTRFTTGNTAASTGLGLTICAQIVRLHHGSICVDGRCPNTTIVIELPHAGRGVRDAA